jgi:FtsP/CotA-like multicopper oxidase with cupredoxin domain
VTGIALLHQTKPKTLTMEHKTNIVTYELEASAFQWEIAPGKTVNAWGFNHQIPGPVLKAKKGDTMVIRVTNNLEESTIVHWHGIRLPAAMDGTGEVQKPIQPGEVFEYRFVVPDAGSFWYHSHANETEQMERGMYGALIVEDDNDPVMDGDRVFMIDDMKLTSKNAFTKPGWALPRLIERHDGREGNTTLLNGKENPTIHVHAGQKERWRFINSSSARYVTLYLGGREFTIIGTDGGLLEKPETVTQVLLTPGERVDIVAGPFNEGDTFSIESLPYNRTTFLKAKRRQYATVKVDMAKPSAAFVPGNLRKIEPLAPQNAPATRKIKLSVGPSLKNGLDFLVNNKVHVNDEPVKIGELQVWEVANTSMMDHPFHLHGFFFQVLEVNGKAPEHIAWKDTVNLTPRTKIKIAWMPDRPGMWMYHCHILEHHAAGMMANFEVIDGNKPPAPHLHHCH